MSRAYTGPREVSYLFIDGAYWSIFLSEFGDRWFSGAAPEVDYRRLQGHHTKVFYYDCLPARREDEPEADYLPRKAAKEAEFETLREINGWHVSEGLAKHRRRYGTQQKEVDILIAVDMLTHTYRRNMHTLTFIAGDQDFCPLVEAVVREGMYVELWYDPEAIAKELKNFADAARKLDLYHLHQYFTPDFQKRFPLPARSHQMGRSLDASHVSLGSHPTTGTVYVHLEGGEFAAYTPAGGSFFDVMRHADLDFLKKAHAYWHGPCEWQDRT